MKVGGLRFHVGEDGFQKEGDDDSGVSDRDWQPGLFDWPEYADYTACVV